jgi:hypothetical protein
LTNLLKDLYSHSTHADPAYTLTKLVISRCKLDNDCHNILDALKMAQLHCLSMDLISPEAIKDIFDATVKLPAQNWMRLLIHNTSFRLWPPTTLNLTPTSSSSTYQLLPPTYFSTY